MPANLSASINLIEISANIAKDPHNYHQLQDNEEILKKFSYEEQYALIQLLGQSSELIRKLLKVEPSSPFNNIWYGAQ